MFAMLLVYFLIAHICNGDMDILVIGDWGGAEMTPYTTPEELATANVMNRISSSLKPSMIWALGDNFYLKGVEDINDHRFQDVWANVFNGSAIESIPFYVVAGNHDHYGNVSAEIAYSNVSSRWIFPDYWYTKTWNVPDTTYTLQLLMIDTILLCGNTMNEEYCKYEGIADKDCILSPMGPQDTDIADQQWEWIQKELNSSTASYLIIGGHYPVWSIAEHGPTSCLVNQLRPMLIENNVTLLMTGHDHTFEYIQEDEFPGLGYVDTGGAHECNPSTKHEKDIPIGSLKFHDCNDGGFTRVHIDKDGLFVDYYFGNDTNVYFKTQTFKPRM
eukprot:208972_1